MDNTINQNEFYALCDVEDSREFIGLARLSDGVVWITETLKEKI